MKVIIPWITTLIMAISTGHFMDKYTAEVKFSNGVLETLHIYATENK